MWRPQRPLLTQELIVTIDDLLIPTEAALQILILPDIRIRSSS